MKSFDKLRMRPEEFRLIKEFIVEVFGLVLDDNKEGFLTQKLLPRLEELRLSSFADYYAYLKFAPRNSEEHKRLISLITNNETYFFREEPQLKVLVEEVLPSLKEKKFREGDRTLRIVSAGCSSGEEVYTLAMLVLESGNFFWDWDVQITGIDVDPQIVAKASGGIYGERAFQATPAHYMDRYFRLCAEGMKVKEIVTRITRFVEGNLLQIDRIMNNERADIVFCRNVLIYFDEQSIRRGVEAFASVLKPEGYLFLGHSESLSRITTRYTPMRFPGAIIYRKRD